MVDDLVDIENGEMIDSVVVPLLSRFENKFLKNGTLKEKIIKGKIEKKSFQIKELYLNEIKKHLMKAQELSQSDILPNNQYKQFLQVVPAYIINRMLEEIKITV